MPKFFDRKVLVREFFQIMFTKISKSIKVNLNERLQKYKCLKKIPSLSVVLSPSTW
jgi:hypothetical protein